MPGSGVEEAFKPAESSTNEIGKKKIEYGVQFLSGCHLSKSQQVQNLQQLFMPS